MNKEFIEAIEQIEEEKGIPKATVLEAIEAALLSAYKNIYGTNQNVRVEIDDQTGEINVYDDKKNETVFSGFVTAGGNMISGTFRGKPIKAQGVGD